MKAVLVLALCMAVAVSAIAVNVDVDVEETGKPRRLRGPLKAARVIANPLMRKRSVTIVPKGDPRARAPAVAAVPVAPVMPAAIPAAVPAVVPAAVVPSVPAANTSPAVPAPSAADWLSPAVELQPESSLPRAPIVLKAAAGNYCTASATNIRAKPTTTGAVVLTTTANEAVRVTAATETPANGYVWVPVAARGKTGWVAKSLLSACRTATPTAPATTRSYPLYKQCGQSWSPAQLGSCAGNTICKAGCAISSVAMYLKARGVDTDPGRLNTWLRSNGGYSGCAIYWAKVDALGKTRCQGFATGNQATVCGWIASSKGVILNVNNGGHWVLATGCQGTNMLVNDPGYSKTSYPFSQVGRMVLYNPI